MSTVTRQLDVVRKNVLATILRFPEGPGRRKCSNYYKVSTQVAMNMIIVTNRRDEEVFADPEKT